MICRPSLASHHIGWVCAQATVGGGVVISAAGGGIAAGEEGGVSIEEGVEEEITEAGVEGEGDEGQKGLEAGNKEGYSGMAGNTQKKGQERDNVAPPKTPRPSKASKGTLVT